MFQLLSTTTPQVAQIDINKNATRWYVSAHLDNNAARPTGRQHQKRNSLVGFSSSRPQLRKAHRAATAKTQLVGRFQLHSATTPQAASLIVRVIVLLVRVQASPPSGLI